MLLYELLTGTTPFDKKRFAKAAYDEIRRMIREEEPPKPSTRLSTSDSIASIAAQRQTEPAKLSKLMRGDLDWIMMKALEKDRTRRYETANGLARDIQRYLSDEPVEACPPSATYRLRKFAKKNRAALTTAAAIALLLVAGVAVSTWQAVRATQAEQIALQARQAEAERAEGERLAKLDAEASEKLAGDGRSKSRPRRRRPMRRSRSPRRCKDFLQNKAAGANGHDDQAETSLKAGESASGAKLNPTIRELLDRAAKELLRDKIEASFTEPAADRGAILRTSWATFYRGIWAKSPTAIDFLKRSVSPARQQLGPDHPDTLTSMNNLAMAYQARREAGPGPAALRGDARSS